MNFFKSLKRDKATDKNVINQYNLNLLIEDFFKTIDLNAPDFKYIYR